MKILSFKAKLFFMTNEVINILLTALLCAELYNCIQIAAHILQVSLDPLYIEIYQNSKLNIFLVQYCHVVEFYLVYRLSTNHSNPICLYLMQSTRVTTIKIPNVEHKNYQFVDLYSSKVEQWLTRVHNWAKFTASACRPAGLPVTSFKRKQCNHTARCNEHSDWITAFSMLW